MTEYNILVCATDHGNNDLRNYFYARLTSLFLVFSFSFEPSFALSNRDLFQQAGSYETQGQINKAKQTYGQISDAVNSQDPLVFRSKVRIARLNLEQSNWKEANAIYQAALKLTPEQMKKDPELMIDLDDLAESYLKLAKKTPDGKMLHLHALQLRLKIDPNHPSIRDSYRELASYSLYHADLAEAARFMTTSIERQKNANTPKKLTSLASDQVMLLGIYIGQKRWAECEAKTKTMLVETSKHPTLHWVWPELHGVLAMCYAHRGEYDLSDSEYRSTIALSKKYPGVRPELIAECWQGIKNNMVLRQKKKKNH
ncbi:MAG: hypothetical protein WCT03_11445 [Candidatus Obscuribacterales bacterium]